MMKDNTYTHFILSVGMQKDKEFHHIWYDPLKLPINDCSILPKPVTGNLSYSQHLNTEINFMDVL